MQPEHKTNNNTEINLNSCYLNWETTVDVKDQNNPVLFALQWRYNCKFKH